MEEDEEPKRGSAWCVARVSAGLCYTHTHGCTDGTEGRGATQMLDVPSQVDLVLVPPILTMAQTAQVVMP